MTVITISRQFGSSGDEIAYRLSQELGYRIFDKRMIREAAKESGFSDRIADDVLDYSEDNHQVQNFLDRLFDSVSVLPYVGVWPNDLTIQYNLDELPLQKEDCLRLVQKAVQRAHEIGNIVIVGRAGQVLLKGQPDVFHVRIIAPFENRSRKIKEQLKQNNPENTPDLERQYEAQAMELVARRDAASAAYIQDFYHVHWDDPLLYHLVLNTGQISVDQATRIILQLAHLLHEEHQQVG